ncbi:asparagine synthase-related protein [Erythrobacter sp. THAF29]|uniref:asparagine synthase-related protein n=1 Tax=Erythrobacter sp. THAF29 TaxID=2587851 RepID=UPI001268CEAA|nr:asparagine synthase-related protein [Erythrobacter sp. THAF29]QFT78509.1 Asparagine synthetase [glutamine-hydrolyzing] 3 [Erythrobacter sp. THAF29]
MTKGANCFRWADGICENETRLLFAKVRLDNRSHLIEALALPQDVTDPDLLLALYSEHGVECADLILGDFAFAIWDADRGRVYAARDIMGCQPVYYSNNGEGFFIAERLEQLLVYDTVSRREDEPYIAATLTRAFAHFERTSFAEIRKIPPGNYIIADPDGTTITPYWRPEQISLRQWNSHEECLSEFRQLLRQAIADRLPVKGNVGVHVSGGLDCSSIAILTAKMLSADKKPPPIALTWYPAPHPEQSEIETEEYERVAAVCARMHVEPVYTEPSVDIVLDVLDRDHRTNPICNASYNELPVLEQASEAGVTVIFSGFGGDEAASFDGRGYFEELASNGHWEKLASLTTGHPRGSLRFVLASLADSFAHRFASDERLRRFQEDRRTPGVSGLRAILRLISPPGWRRTSGAVGDDDQRRGFLDGKAWNSIEALPPIPVVRTPNTRAARCNLLRWPGLITRIESMASDAAPYGIRHVYPMMDRRIVEFALSLPSHVFRDKHWKRLFFRQAMDPILPEEVCWREIKDDPARVTPLLLALKGAFAIVGKRYSSGESLPARSRYVDMERLIRDLDPNSFERRSRIGRIWSAVEFVGAASRENDSK